MTVHDNTGFARDARRAHIEALIGDYPELTEQEIALLKTWFTRQASALEVAQVASNAAIDVQYRAFRAVHLDPITPKEWLKWIAAVAAGALCVAALMWRAL